MDELERDARAWNRAAIGADRRHRVFCGSMCDVFEGRADQQPSLARLWPLIEETRKLNWLLLSKRPNIGKRLLAEAWTRISDNVWVGCTAENQEWADKRIPHLLEMDAAYRFVSVEPQVGPVDLSGYLGHGPGKINWVICGGESGVRARGFKDMLSWYRSLRDQCVAAGVPFFFKQWGCFSAEGEVIYKLRGKNPDNILDGMRWEQHPDVASEPQPARPSTRRGVRVT